MNGDVAPISAVDLQISAEDLWWSWAVAAASSEGTGRDGVLMELLQDDHVLTLDQGDAWLRMQRLRGGRALLWGRVTQPPVTDIDVLDGAPDWASSDAVFRATNQQDPEFLAWYAHGEWDSNTGERWEDSLHLFDRIRQADPVQVRAARQGESDNPLLVAARGSADLNAQGAMRKRLRSAIHRQMRDAREFERSLPERPTLLVRWARVARPQFAFEHQVVAREGTVVALSTEPPLPADAWTSLTNVLQQLHTAEASEESGGWLVARVVYNGRAIRLERAFDSLPPWFTRKGPRLHMLAWEMRQRTRRWRPAWTSLLPDRLD